VALRARAEHRPAPLTALAVEKHRSRRPRSPPPARWSLGLDEAGAHGARAVLVGCVEEPGQPPLPEAPCASRKDEDPQRAGRAAVATGARRAEALFHASRWCAARGRGLPGVARARRRRRPLAPPVDALAAPGWSSLRRLLIQVLPSPTVRRPRSRGAWNRRRALGGGDLAARAADASHVGHRGEAARGGRPAVPIAAGSIEGAVAGALARTSCLAKGAHVAGEVARVLPAVPQLMKPDEPAGDAPTSTA
jgi:hypothetical protein